MSRCPTRITFDSNARQQINKRQLPTTKNLTDRSTIRTSWRENPHLRWRPLSWCLHQEKSLSSVNMPQCMVSLLLPQLSTLGRWIHDHAEEWITLKSAIFTVARVSYPVLVLYSAGSPSSDSVKRICLGSVPRGHATGQVRKGLKAAQTRPENLVIP